ncbi:hypothetical protein DER45DRAFT_634227 [Fusarium avenaceum]|nr:hypothetical protein DER45DRAFT_634227 [Fusarium avenaceum]
MVLSWEGWTAAGSIAAIFGAIIAVFAQALHAVSLLSPGSLPPPRPRLRPSDVVAAEEAEAHALQQFRAAVNGWLENLVDQVRELRMALLPAEGETAEVLWDRLRDGSMTVKEILTALRDLQQETRDDLIALRGHLDSVRLRPDLAILLLTTDLGRPGMRTAFARRVRPRHGLRRRRH